MLADRRSLLAGLAALPAAGLPIAAMAAARPDPFAAYHAEVLAIHAAVCAADDDDGSDPHVNRWAEVDHDIMHLRPTSLAEAASALEYARREYVQFTLQGDPEGGDDGERVVLHLIDGAIAVLRQAAGGGTA